MVNKCKMKCKARRNFEKQKYLVKIECYHFSLGKMSRDEAAGSVL